MRSPLGARTDQPTVEHTRSQETTVESEQTFVGHALGHQSHQEVVIDPVEELLQIKVDHDAQARADVLLRAPHRLMGRASGPKPVARIREASVPVSLQHLHHRLLDEAVKHRGHAERANPA